MTFIINTFLEFFVYFRSLSSNFVAPVFVLFRCGQSPHF